MRVCRLHDADLLEDLLLVIRPFLLVPAGEYLADPEQRGIVEALRELRGIVHMFKMKGVFAI